MKERKHGLLKVLGWVAGIVGVLVVAVAIVASLFLGPIVKQGAESLGPRFLGVPVQVEHVKIRPWSGKAEIEGVLVGNPEGYDTPSAFELGSLVAEVDLVSLMSDVLVIRRLYITAPKVTYEVRGRRSNIDTLIAHLQPKKAPEVAEESPEDAGPVEEKAPAKKIILEHFVFEEGRLSFNSVFTGGKSITTRLPRIELHDVGRDVGGLAAVDLVFQVMRSIMVSVSKGIVELSGQAVGKSAEAIQKLGAAGAGAAGAAAGRLSEGAGAAVGAGGDAVKDAGEAGAKAVQGLGKALGRWLGGGGDGDAEEEPPAQK